QSLTGKRPPDSPVSSWLEIATAIGSELRKWGYYLLWLLPLGLASLLLAPIAPLLWFLFGAWMYSIEYADYPMGNHGLTFSGIRRALRGRRALSLGFGGAVMLVTMTPLLNLLVMPAAVAGATAMTVDHFPEAGEAHRRAV
ncbi:MAG: EI24 domain-containing protein, partial [Pseudomonadota bacterium]|nr:EI24 domain-containing protein [Pseudomonadota bacterium]